MHESATAHEGPLLFTVAAREAALIAEIHELRVENEQLNRAMVSRAMIDQARGMIMVLAHCSSERAWGLLVDISQHRNVKLRDVAAALVATGRDCPRPTLEQICGELRRALERFDSR
ncbi:ANTAR domain-containing protein [Streptomyces sp. Q6]|uniref:ANTAR domain-containing protein n=1 Tax=Streptomyces citrinus TaxID=3118173 RepID=A0ACD5A4S1_9ACTN